MSEFINCKVQLQLKDGQKVVGFISNVNEETIFLENKQFENAAVHDLKVLQLPKKKKKHTPPQPVYSHSDEPLLSYLSDLGTPRGNDALSDVSNVDHIKASEDFDFAANLANFDKQSVFADFKKNDTVSSLDRLVGHNKVEQSRRPQNDKYANDEMVVDSKKVDNWNNIGNSATLRLGLPAPQLGRNPLVANPKDEFKFSFADERPVPLATPVQLLDLTRAAQASVGITEAIMVETGGLNIYSYIVKNLLGGSSRLSNRRNHNFPPLVVLLIGNRSSSCKAYAAGRHLSNHGIRVLAYVITSDDDEPDLIEQRKLFERSGGKVVSDSFEAFSDILTKQLETPVEVIVDALQGFDSQLTDIFYEDESLRKLKRVVQWVNVSKQRLKTVSLEICSGVDAGTGVVEDPELQIRSTQILSLGLPITGLLLAYNNGVLSAEDNIKHFVIDMGIPNAIYTRKPHLRKFEGFWFCAESYLQLIVSAK